MIHPHSPLLTSVLQLDRCSLRGARPGRAETLAESAESPHHPGSVRIIGPVRRALRDESLHHHHCPAFHGSSSATTGTMGRAPALFHAHSAPQACLQSASCDPDHKHEEEDGEYVKSVGGRDGQEDGAGQVQAQGKRRRAEHDVREEDRPGRACGGAWKSTQYLDIMRTRRDVPRGRRAGGERGHRAEHLDHDWSLAQELERGYRRREVYSRVRDFFRSHSALESQLARIRLPTTRLRRWGSECE
ncbi:hypothetical protein B0H13DRAFT_1026176 [Mycena leptocephala]|nr:hypothetical protein B0H13DRAFT_1026176 [Mycena leptocephala]